MTRARDLADSADKDIAGTLTLDDLTVDGSVGIGTSSPSKSLHIKDTNTSTGSTNPPHLRIEGNNGLFYDIGRDNASTGFLSFYGNQLNANGYIFGGANGERMRIDSSGNVGIGETSTDSKFHVKHNIASTGVGSSSSPIVIIQNERLNTGTSSSVLQFDTNEIGGTNQYARAAIGAEYDGSSNVNGRLMFSTADTAGNLQEALRIDGSGNVGIGSNSVDSLEARSSFNYKSLRVQNFNINAGDSNYGFIGQNLYQDTAGQTKYIDNGYSSSIHFWGDQMQFHMGTGSADAAQSNTEKLRMVQNGNMQQFKQTHYGYTYSTNNGYIDTDFTAADGYIFEISGFVNPNSGGSTYRDVFHGHIYIGHGWSGSALTHYVYFVMDTPPARNVYNSGSSASGNDIDVVIHNNGTETTSVSQADSSNWNIRVKAFNYNTSLGSQFALNITRKL